MIWVSKHAIERYQSRITVLPIGEVALRLRRAVSALGAEQQPDGQYVVQLRSDGPPADLKVIVRDGNADVVTVYPVTKGQVQRATKIGAWNPWHHDDRPARVSSWP